MDVSGVKLEDWVVGDTVDAETTRGCLYHQKYQSTVNASTEGEACTEVTPVPR
jgi:hypothetical protein